MDLPLIVMSVAAVGWYVWAWRKLPDKLSVAHAHFRQRTDPVVVLGKAFRADEVKWSSQAKFFLAIVPRITSTGSVRVADGDQLIFKAVTSCPSLSTRVESV